MNDLIELKQNDGLYSLTDLWKASGSDESQRPQKWLRLPKTKEFIEFIKKNSKLEKIPYLKKVRGKYGGTFAHWQLALAYAKYLSPELHAQVNQVFKERLEKNQNPSLGIDRAVDRAEQSYLKQGKVSKSGGPGWEFIEFIAETTNSDVSTIIKAKRGLIFQFFQLLKDNSTNSFSCKRCCGLWNILCKCRNAVKEEILRIHSEFMYQEMQVFK